MNTMPAPSSPVVQPLPRWQRRAVIAAFAALAAFLIAAACAWLVTGAVVPWDSKNHFYPMLRYLAGSIAAGEWPLWNPFHFSGHPTAADPQSLLFTPTMVLFALVAPSPSMQVFDLVIMAHLGLGAAAIVGLFHRRGWHAAGAVLAAMVFVLGGVASSRLQHTGMILSYAFIPVALYTLEAALAKNSVWRAILFAVVAAMMAVGRDQIAYLGCFIVIAAFVAQVAGSSEPLRYLRQRWLVVAVMGVVGIALLAVPVLLTLQFLATSNRPEFGFGTAAMGSMPPASLATFVAPNIFGSINWNYEYWGPGPGTVEGGSWADRATTYVFAGTLTAVLLAWHGLAGGRLLRREIRFYAALTLIGLLYSLGQFTPVFERLFDLVPGVKLYRRPADALFIVNIGLAMVAGYLVHLYLREGLPRWARADRLRPLAIAVAAIGLVGLVAWGAGFSAEQKRFWPALTQGMIACAMIAMAAAALAFGAAPRWRLATMAALVAITGGELVWRNAASSMNAEPRTRYAVFNQLPPEQVRGLSVLRAELAEMNGRGEHPRVEIIGMPNAWQNAAMVFGIEDTIGYNPLRIADFERVVGPGENAEDFNKRNFPPTFRGYRCRVAGLLGLEYLVMARPIEKLPAHFPRVKGATLIYGAQNMYIYRLRQSVPRAYFASRIVTADSEAVIAAGDMPGFDRTREALIDTASLGDLNFDLTEPGPDPASAELPDSQVKITEYRRNAVSIEVETGRPGVLVLHDLYYPGWVARVDGVEQPILKANLLFRGVELPAGRHKVEFVFRPLSIANLTSVARSLLQRPAANVAVSALERTP